jgi:hypothetical protein
MLWLERGSRPVRKRWTGLGPCFVAAIKRKASQFDDFQRLLEHVPKELIEDAL